jgi:hypothetical protein
MKKVFNTIAKWIKFFFAKPIQEAEVKQSEMTVEEKKKVVSKFNQHKEILNVTIRDKKPREFSKRKEVNVETPIGDFKLTKKQERFLDIISKSNRETGIKMNEVCQKFLDFKYKDTQMTPNEEELKPNYHKKTINYLLKCELIVKVENAKNHYKLNY